MTQSETTNRGEILSCELYAPRTGTWKIRESGWWTVIIGDTTCMVQARNSSQRRCQPLLPEAKGIYWSIWCSHPYRSRGSQEDRIFLFLKNTEVSFCAWEGHSTSPLNIMCLEENPLGQRELMELTGSHSCKESVSADCEMKTFHHRLISVVWPLGYWLLHDKRKKSTCISFSLCLGNWMESKFVGLLWDVDISFIFGMLEIIEHSWIGFLWDDL